MLLGLTAEQQTRNGLQTTGAGSRLAGPQISGPDTERDLGSVSPDTATRRWSNAARLPGSLANPTPRLVALEDKLALRDAMRAVVDDAKNYGCGSLVAGGMMCWDSVALRSISRKAYTVLGYSWFVHRLAICLCGGVNRVGSEFFNRRDRAVILSDVARPRDMVLPSRSNGSTSTSLLIGARKRLMQMLPSESSAWKVQHAVQRVGSAAEEEGSRIAAGPASSPSPSSSLLLLRNECMGLFQSASIDEALTKQHVLGI
ncbi:hypothetical protein LTR53_003940 [Teratosphaeriaceae sp. CCFEE 6253]|nr:hypothetical protein LTR53_003940 [Teratosphaeriaceae sp. CCFEE 6253]